MLSNTYRVARMQKTLRWFEGDIPLLNLRVKDLSPEGQQSARKFALALVDQTRAELHRLLEERGQIRAAGPWNQAPIRNIMSVVCHSRRYSLLKWWAVSDGSANFTQCHRPLSRFWF